MPEVPGFQPKWLFKGSRLRSNWLWALKRFAICNEVTNEFTLK